MGTLWSIFGIFLILLIAIETVGYLLARKSTARVTASNISEIESFLPDEDKSEAKQFFHETMADGVMQPRWEPFAYFRTQEFQGRYVNVNAQGLRATWNPPPRATDRPLRIFVFGGSSVWGFGVRDECTVASWLSRVLHQQQVSANVTNFGQNAYVSTQELIALTRELQHNNRPDVVIFVDGFNDLLTAAFSMQFGQTYAEGVRQREFNITKVDMLSRTFKIQVQETSLFRLATAIRGWVESSSPSDQVPTAGSDQSIIPLSIQRRWAEFAEAQFRDPAVVKQFASERRRRGLTDDEEIEKLAHEIVLRQWAVRVAGVYANNVKLLRGIAKEYDFQLLVYLQPLLFSKEHLTSKEQEMAFTFREFRLYADPVYQYVRDAIEGDATNPLTEIRRVGEFFAVPEWESKTAFIDYCHTSEDANRRIATVIATDLLADD